MGYLQVDIEMVLTVVTWADTKDGEQLATSSSAVVVERHPKTIQEKRPKTYIKNSTFDLVGFCKSLQERSER